MIGKTLTILSLLGLLLIAGLWWVSYLGASFTSEGRLWEMHLVSLGHCQILFSSDHTTPSTMRSGWRRNKRAFQWRGWVPRIGGSGPWYFVRAPLWLPSLVLAVLLVFGLLPRHRRRKRKKLGLCLKCGYDLRASKERCPECGSEFESSGA